MKPRQQRMLAVGLAALGIAIAAGLTLRAFQDNMMFFVEISDVAAGNYPKERNFRIGRHLDQLLHKTTESHTKREHLS